MKQFLSNTILLLLIIILIAATYGVWQLKDRHPDISWDINSIQSEGKIRVGAAALPIVPKYFETWTDKNQDAQYDANIDEFHDANDNGKFDAIWLAGFQSARPMQAVHDSIWASAIVIEVGKKQVGILSLDVIGLGNDASWEIRKRVLEKTGVEHINVLSSHNHQAPDLIGLWGPKKFTSGVNETYLEYLIDQSVYALTLAFESRQDACITIAQDTTSAKMLLQDSRPPFVINPTVNSLQAKSLRTNQTIATLVNWGNHVETLWDQNIELTSDFVHYLRKGITDGVADGEESIVPAQGGVCIFVPGTVGGLMTTSPDLSIRHPVTNAVHTKPTFEKAEAQGFALAKIVTESLLQEGPQCFFHTTLRSHQQAIELPLANTNFRLGAYLGLLDRGTTSWMQVRSEIGFWQLGAASFMHVPGELYPELFIGGIEEPEGADFANLALEVPSLESVMPGKYHWLMGLSNDMIGYILPRSQWDEAYPYTYGQAEAPYGEAMSLGPETAPKIHAALLSLLARNSQLEEAQ